MNFQALERRILLLNLILSLTMNEKRREEGEAKGRTSSTTEAEPSSFAFLGFILLLRVLSFRSGSSSSGWCL